MANFLLVFSMCVRLLELKYVLLFNYNFYLPLAQLLLSSGHVSYKNLHDDQQKYLVIAQCDTKHCL